MKGEGGQEPGERSVLAAILLFTLIVFSLSAIYGTNVKSECLRCGYPDHIVYMNVGYCLRIEDGTEVVVSVDNACPRRVEQGKEKE
jgi:hypothetical protein